MEKLGELTERENGKVRRDHRERMEKLGGLTERRVKIVGITEREWRS